MQDIRTLAPLLRSLAASKQEPHGGKLVNLFTEDIESEVASCSMELQLTDRQSCDVELLCNGGFSPLEGFMDEETYGSVVDQLHGDARAGARLMFSDPLELHQLTHAKCPQPPLSRQ